MCPAFVFLLSCRNSSWHRDSRQESFKGVILWVIWQISRWVTKNHESKIVVMPNYLSITHTSFKCVIGLVIQSKITRVAKLLGHWLSKQQLDLSICVSVCVSVCVFTFEVPLKSLFVPTFRSRMSKMFRDSEEKYWKQMVSYSKFLQK